MTADASAQEELRILGVAFGLHQQGRLAEAAPLYERILASNPKNFDALHLRGVIGTQTGDYPLAQRYLERALALQPRSTAALSNFCVLWFAMGESSAALEYANRILQIDPRNAEALNDRGRALTNLDRLEEALASFSDALAIRPGYAEAHYNRGAIFLKTGQIAEAADAFAAAAKANPDLLLARAMSAQCQWQFCEWADYDGDRKRILEAVRAGVAASTPVFFLSISDSAQDQLIAHQAHVQSIVKGGLAPPWLANPYRHERLRVAYVSADFREHAVSYLIAGLIEAHDRERFEIIGIALGPEVHDPMAQRMQRAFDRFIPVNALSDQAAADAMRALQIDIAVDLTGMTRNERSGILARRPAPIQISYLGFPGTSGAPWIDFIIGDAIVTPESLAAYYSEKVLRMPVSFQVSDDKRPVAAQTLTRRDAGLPDDALVFASFNNNAKITPEVFTIWMRLLGSVPGSVLWIVAPQRRSQENLLREARQRGITADRLIFAESLPYEKHLVRIGLADIFLDTFPFTGGTTVNDALWAGLPVVTRIGEAFAARMAASLLHGLDLSDLIAKSAEDYEAIALKLARDAAFRARIEERLSGRHAAELFNTQAFCDVLETGYEEIVRRSRRGESPESLNLGRGTAAPPAEPLAPETDAKARSPRRQWMPRWLRP